MLLSLLFLFALPARLLAQAPNNVAAQFPNDETATCNCSHILVKVPRSTALSLLPHGYSLLKPTGLPHGYLAADEFPLYLLSGYLFDLHQGSLRLPHLSQANVYVPFVDVLHDGKTPFLFNPLSFLDQAAPAAIGNQTGFSYNEVATFDPANAAYKSAGHGFSFAVSQNHPRFEYKLQRSSHHTVPAHTFHTIANMPRLNANTTEGPKCGRTLFWFNQTYSDPFSASGKVHLFPPVLPHAASFAHADAYVGTAAWITPSSPGFDCSAYRH